MDADVYAHTHIISPTCVYVDIMSIRIVVLIKNYIELWHASKTSKSRCDWVALILTDPPDIFSCQKKLKSAKVQRKRKKKKQSKVHTNSISKKKKEKKVDSMNQKFLCIFES